MASQHYENSRKFVSKEMGDDGVAILDFFAKGDGVKCEFGKPDYDFVEFLMLSVFAIQPDKFREVAAHAREGRDRQVAEFFAEITNTHTDS